MEEMSLYKHCQGFIKSRRNFSDNGHEKKNMFSVSTPFTCIEGLRFTLVSNGPFDYLDYVPTPQHVFLDEASLQGFERYVDLMFSEDDKIDDCSFFKILCKLGTHEYQQLTSFVKTGRFGKKPANDDYRVPISLIPVAEFQLLEDCSRVYCVKSTSASNTKSQIRIKLNTYFHTLLKLLNCSEEDVLDILYKKGVLPSKDFQLISTQKDLTIALKRYRSCGLQERFQQCFRNLELLYVLIKPKYTSAHTNLCQALQQLFALHPLYVTRQQNLLVETEFIGDGKGCLEHAVRSKKRITTEIPKGSLPAKLLCKSSVASTQTQEGSILAEAMCRCMPELYVPPGKTFLTLNIDKELIPDLNVYFCSDDQIVVENELVE